jgi:hypothetical protein
MPDQETGRAEAACQSVQALRDLGKSHRFLCPRGTRTAGQCPRWWRRGPLDARLTCLNSTFSCLQPGFRDLCLNGCQARVWDITRLGRGR